MTYHKTRRCRECGDGLIRPLAREGRAYPYKDLMLPVPADLEIPTCSDCGSEWIDAPTARALDNALEDAYLEWLKAENVKLLRGLKDRYETLSNVLKELNARWRRDRT